MAFFDDMKDKFSMAGLSTVKKAKDLSEIAKLNTAVSDAELKITDLYSQIGYTIYCSYKDNPIPEVTELIQKVTELHSLIEDYQTQIKQINTSNSCPECGTKIRLGMNFCNVCGFKLPVTNNPVLDKGKFCSKCGKEIRPGCVFCPSCGNKVEEA